MCNRFVVALVIMIPIVPIVFCASTIFFTGAVRALRDRTLDSVAATFFIEGDVDPSLDVVTWGLQFAGTRVGQA